MESEWPSQEEIILNHYSREEMNMDNIEKLYGAVSFADDFKDRKNVRIDWFRAGPRRQDVKYAQLIEDYGLLNESEKRTAEEIIDEFFTKEELEILREYLIRKKYLEEGDFLVTRFSVPMRVKRETGGLFSTVGEISYGSNTLHLNMEPDCDLPFEVWGHYNIDNHSPADRLPWEHIHDGLQFLEEATKAVLPDLDAKGLFNEALVNEIYQRRGLYVVWNMHMPVHRERSQSQ